MSLNKLFSGQFGRSNTQKILVMAWVVLRLRIQMCLRNIVVILIRQSDSVEYWDVLVPDYTTLAAVNSIINVCFGWPDTDPYEFVSTQRPFSCQMVCRLLDREGFLPAIRPA